MSKAVRRPRPAPPDSRTRVFAAAADLFADRGFDGVGVDDIASASGLNKAMLYYHFDDKLALYRAIVVEMLDAVSEQVAVIAAEPVPADQRLTAFVRLFVDQAAERPWLPPLMLREMAEGAPRLDIQTFSRMRTVFTNFARILDDGHREGRFRRINPVLAYMSIIAPVLLNGARERAGAAPGRQDYPMFVQVPRADILAHMQQGALRLLSLEPSLP